MKLRTLRRKLSPHLCDPSHGLRLAAWAVASGLLHSAAHAKMAEVSYYVLGSDSSVALVLDGQANQPTPAATTLGLNTGDELVAIDVRPQNGRLYGLGQNPKLGTVQLYAMEWNRSVVTATPVGSAGSFLDSAGVALPILAAGFDMDFNPSVDRLRIVATNGLNFRMNPNNGALIDGDFGGAVGTVAGVNPDARLNIAGTPTQAMATAYTNSEINAGVTTQYSLDHVNNALYIQNPPNAGTLISPLPVTLGNSVLDFSSAGGLDIEPGVNVATAGSAATGSAVAVLNAGGLTRLYRIDLSSGSASILGDLGGFAAIDVAVNAAAPTAYVLSSSGTRLIRFALSTPGLTTQASVIGVMAGERLVGMDTRARNGVLYALGIDELANKGSLYRLEPQSASGSAVASVIGSAGQIAFVDQTGQAVDLSDVSYGVDFNPAADRLRVVDASGLNFRINPDTGLPVDGDAVMAGINTDANISAPLATQLAGTAYTNSTATAAFTTQYTIDQLSGKLSIQNPPNSGVQTLAQTITLSGAPLDLGGVGFDIPTGVNASAANQPLVQGTGYFTSSPSGSIPRLYRLNLQNAQASAIGEIASGGLDLDSLVINGAPSDFQVSTASLRVTESAIPAAIVIERIAGGSGLIRFITANGTAQAGSDFTPTAGTLAFGTNDSQAIINVPVLQDGIDEPEETFLINLTLPNGQLLSLTITIVNDRIFSSGFE